jgi:hypothetical protein
VTALPLELLDELALVLLDEELEDDVPVWQSFGYVLLGSAPPGGGTQS